MDQIWLAELRRGGEGATFTVEPTGGACFFCYLVFEGFALKISECAQGYGEDRRVEHESEDHRVR